tara:strand:- start:642 stop:794 length:153 start_codon:yes stop_codon:yes gene_type:complete
MVPVEEVATTVAERALAVVDGVVEQEVTTVAERASVVMDGGVDGIAAQAV